MSIEQSAAASSPHDPYAALRAPQLGRYWLGTQLAQIGMGAQGLAVGWEVFQRTHQFFSLGLVGALQAVPMILLSLPSGYLADRLNRQRLIACCLVGVALCSLGLSWVSYHHLPIIWMYLLLALDAALMVLQRPASAALLPALIPAELFENAYKWKTSLDQISAMAGPALGAALAALSLPLAYAASALCALVFIGLLLSLRLRPSPARAGELSFVSLFAGLRFVFARKILLAAISLDLFAVLLGGAVYLLPVYASDILNVGATGLGWLRAAPAVGAFAMALLLAHRPPLRKAGRTMLLAVAGFGIATIIFGISRNFYLSWAMLVVTGALDNISVVVRHTLVQLCTPDAMRGRVSAVNFIFIGSSNEIGGFESGAVAQLLRNPVLSVVFGGVGTLAVVVIWALAFPHLRRFGAFQTAEELPDQAG